MNRADTLAQGILACKALTGRYLDGFDDANATRQAPDLPNHVAWTLGHCALYMHRVGAQIDGGVMPANDFYDGEPDPKQTAPYALKAISFGSEPANDPDLYPPHSRCVAIYDGACDRLATAVKSAPDARLDEPVMWGSRELPLAEVLFRIVFHNGQHTGQIADLRRAFKMPTTYR